MDQFHHDIPGKGVIYNRFPDLTWLMGIGHQGICCGDKSFPAVFTEVVKKSRTKYLYNGEKLNVKEIYSRNKKRRGCSRYLLSVSVTVEKEGESIPAKFVYVRNKSKRKDWLVIVSTDTELSGDWEAAE